MAFILQAPEHNYGEVMFRWKYHLLLRTFYNNPHIELWSLQQTSYKYNRLPNEDNEKQEKEFKCLLLSELWRSL